MSVENQGARIGPGDGSTVDSAVGQGLHSREKVATPVLIDFSVSRFRSFGVEQTLNMVAAGLDDHADHLRAIPDTTQSVLRTGVIYGANAAGKSNLVRAMDYARHLILGHATPRRMALDRFRFASKTFPASFEFRFLSAEHVYRYGFSLTQDEIRSETLVAVGPNEKETVIFDRTKSGIEVADSKSQLSGIKSLRDTLAALKLVGVRDDQLLLAKIVEMPEQSRGKVLGAVVHWFDACLTVIPAGANFTALLDMLNEDSGFRRFCSAFLDNAGTGISDVNVETKDINVDKAPKPVLEALTSGKGESAPVFVGFPGTQFELHPADTTKIVRRNLVARHRVRDVDYPVSFAEESDGTRRCLDLLPALYYLATEPRVFVVDEIDRSLHPLLCHALLKLFLEACPGGKRRTTGQLIVTTHQSHLLDPDLLRRDEIWFVEKGRDQESRLRSLAEFKVREGLRVEAGYLQGRFGGVPFIGDLEPLADLIRGLADGRKV